MKFALVNNERCEATPKAKGICPICGCTVIAKCGKKKVNHWAHETLKNCHNDRWETEGEWHQNWKNKFPKEWQEKVIMIDGEKNVADVQNEQGFVVEFQHSYIREEEQQARERCYKSMAWVVDGLRLKNDLPRFLKNFTQNSTQFINNYPLYKVDFVEDVCPKNWINNSVPVLFDFTHNLDDQPLYCLLPRDKKKDYYSSFILQISKNEFITRITNNQWQDFYSILCKGIADIEKEWDRINRCAY